VLDDADGRGSLRSLSRHGFLVRITIPVQPLMLFCESAGTGWSASFLP